MKNKMIQILSALLAVGFAGAATADHVHCLCGDGACTAAGHSHSDVAWSEWTATDSLPNSAGNWYLANDVTLSSTYTPPTGVNLCLNGHVVRETTSGQRVITVNSGVTFAITDCNQAIAHNFKVGSNGLWAYTTDAATTNYEDLAARPAAGAVVAVKGGAITGGNTGNSGFGGGIYSAGILSIYGGNVIGNMSGAKQSGGGLYVGRGSGDSAGSTFTMFGGTVAGNYSGSYGGGISINAKVIANVLGGDISFNVGQFGGGLEGSFAATCPVTIGGNLRIANNAHYTEGTPNNLYIYSGYPVTVSTDTPLTNNAAIGVFTEAKPSGATKVPVTSNRGDDLAYFTSDEGYNVIKENDQVKLMGEVSFTLTFYNRPTSTDETIGGQPFNNAPTNVVYNYGGSTAQTPNVVKPNAKFLGWSTSPTGTVPEYTNDQLSTITTTPDDNITLYSVYGVEVGVPVYVAMDDCSTLPDDGREYSFAITNLDSFTTLPTNCVVTLSMPTGRGEANCVGFGPEDIGNPWRLTYTAGDYYYHVSQITNGCHAGEKLDEGTWEIMITVDPDATPRYKVESAIYYGKVADLDEDSFQIVKADDAVAAAVSVEGSKTKVALGGDKVVSGDGFNTAVMKGKFEIDFSRNFRVVGSFTPPNSSVPDGTCIGFMPYAGSLSQSDVHGGGLLGYMGCTKFAKSVVLDFDPYLNGSLYGDPGYKHFSLTETMDNGYPNYNTAQHKNVASCWPTSASQYTILNDTTENKLSFKVTLPNSTVLEYEYANPTNFFKASKAYFFMSGVVRKGPANSYGCGAVGSTAPSLTMYFDSFNYLGQPAGYDSIPGLFVNRQEALVAYNAWGGQFADGEETNVTYATDAVVEFPVDPTRNGYDLDGWYQSWTNGAAKVSEGLLDPIADQTLYAKWISKSSPTSGEDPKQGDGTLAFEPVTTNADGSAVIGAGALLKGATNVLETTDLAIPEFTSNGPDGVPYVIIEEGAFARENYDKKLERKFLSKTNDLTSVTISTYVTNIQSYAFSRCESLTNVTFTKTRDYLSGSNAVLHVRDWAFQESSVKSVVFPANTKVVLDYGAFADAEYLEDITFRGDVELQAKYPFVGCGTRVYTDQTKATRKPVTIHLSAKLAANADFVAALTNGMSAARLDFCQTIEGKMDDAEYAFDTASDPQTVTVTFTVPEDSYWLAVNENTVYLFYSTDLTAEKTFIGNPTCTLVGGPVKNSDGSYTATFELPEVPSADAVYFQFCLGEAR